MPKAVDANQPAVVAALRAAGATVQHAHEVGRGFPDLIVGKTGITYLIEVKNPETKGKLNKLQREFFATWRGHAVVIRTVEEALRVIGASP